MHRRDSGWRLGGGLLVAGDLLASVLAYLAAWGIRMGIPLPLTTGYIPALRFSEVQHHLTEMVLVQGAALYFLGLYETRALIRPPRLLLLDEPTASLDAGARAALVARLRELKAAGVAMIGVFHHPGDVAALIDGEIELRAKEVNDVAV